MSLHSWKIPAGKVFESRIEAIKNFTKGKNIDDILNSKSSIDEIAEKTGLSKYYIVQILKKEKMPKKQEKEIDEEIAEEIIKEMSPLLIKTAEKILKRRK